MYEYYQALSDIWINKAREVNDIYLQVFYFNVGRSYLMKALNMKVEDAENKKGEEK